MGAPSALHTLGSRHTDERERHCLPKEGDECESYLITGLLVCETLPEGAAEARLLKIQPRREPDLGLHKELEPTTGVF